MHLVFRKTCRACGSSALTKVIDLGDQHIQGAFVKPGEAPPPFRKVPLALVRCDPTVDERACGLLQTSCTVPPEILYSRYWYRSGTNRTMSDHLTSIASEAVSLIEKQQARTLDIGCNDGTLLRAYPATYERFGIDPSNAIEALPEHITGVRDVFPSPELTIRAGPQGFDVITSIAMFYDLERPLEFVRAIRDALAPDGIWIFEMSYMPSMLSTTSYDTICHEHLEYYSLAVVEKILDSASLKLFRADMNQINGGSIRCYAVHKSNFRFQDATATTRLQAIRRAEFDQQLDTDKPYRDFQDKVDRHRDDLSRLIKDLKRQGKRIHAYGASTKGNTILQFCGLDNSVIDYAADRNPDKFGARTIGTDIPIISEAESRRMRPDYYLVLPWHFREEFVAREAATMRDGSAMIFPLPNIEVVSSAESAREGARS